MKWPLIILLLVCSAPSVIAESIGFGGSTNIFIDFPNWNNVVVEPVLEGVSDFFTGLIIELFGAPINQLLSWFRGLLGHNYDFESLKPVWNLVRHIISLFYGLLLLGAGFKFLISSSDPVARDNAKRTFKNAVLMIVLVQASFLIFTWFGEIANGLTNGVLNLIPTDFFEINTVFDLAMTFAFNSMIMLTIIMGIVTAGLQIIGSYAGLLFFPIGIFLYYFTPTRAAGNLFMSMSVGILFLSFFQSIIFLIGSGIGELAGLGGNQPLLVFITISAYNTLSATIVFFLVVKAASATMSSDTVRIARMVA